MTQQLILDVLPAPPPSLENFVTGKNRAVIDALTHFEPGRAIYLWGAPGVGRTHLLKALGNAPDALYAGSSEQACALLDLATSDVMPLKLVAIDDVDHLSDAAQAAVFALYNRWREVSATTHAFSLVLAGDQAPLALHLREDLRTRLGCDLVFRLELLSDPDRIEALKTRARERGLVLGPDVINWMITHYARDMSRLGALLDALDRYSLAKHRAITLPLLKDLLSTNPAHNEPNWL